MRKHKEYIISDNFLHQFLEWGQQFDCFMILDSNQFYENRNLTSAYHTFQKIAAVGVQSVLDIEPLLSFESLKKYRNFKNDWLFGYFSYDLKNETEKLESQNPDFLCFPEIHFFQPELVFIFQNKTVEIHFLENFSENKADDIFHEIINTQNKNNQQLPKSKIQSRFTKEEYIQTVYRLIEHIKRGDIYEVNLCQEFFIENLVINPLDIYKKLTALSPMPFSGFYKNHHHYLMCASPERYLKKVGNKLISQPIKGTKQRGYTTEEDNKLKKILLSDTKEISENIMIVDLVRNDLSVTAAKNSVIVEEKCALYSFRQVHQLISTITSEMSCNFEMIDAIKYSFPMGSMTGAPKIRAMQLIDKYEKTKRGLFSGSIGYFAPNADFDFNVVIRSILYNAENQYLSYSAGSAITAKSIPEKEYEECLLKAQAMMKLFESEG